MSNADDPKKPPPSSTMAFTAEDVAALTGAPQEPKAPEQPEEDPLIGQLLRNKWRVLKRIGAGGFGTVYKVRDEKGGWIEALKILSVERITGAEVENARKRFLREAQIMKRLGTESPHIVGLSTYEEDLEAGLIYFLMEYVEGKSLADTVLAEGPLPRERAVRLALQACEALIVAHEGPDGVVHRDLKLENFMLTKDRSGQEIVKVLDFGIAKLTEKEADSRLTTVGTLGTPGYAAPEQLRAEKVDARTDLFAFGVVLYGLLTGRDPWLGNRAGESTTEIYQLMVATDRGEVIPMSETGANVPPALESLVLKLLRREPDQRFQSARELKDALQRVQAGGLEADVGSLRVLTEPKGVKVEIRHGRRTVAEGPTPCVANGIAAGSYRVVVKDD
ncbi:MAG: serine/threonine protein kinase, partial [Gemmatimonadetes bacterium]|nr:serine/threonine protein kinase [Gemmatimonadota bacterium]